MRISLLLLAILAASSCVLPTDACGCPPAVGVGVVAGKVIRGDRSPVINASVRIEARARGCSDPLGDVIVGLREVRTNAAGDYVMHVMTSIPTDSACIRLVARAPTESADSIVAERIRMRLVPNYGTRQRRDSLRVDFQLP